MNLFFENEYPNSLTLPPHGSQRSMPPAVVEQGVRQLVERVAEAALDYVACPFEAQISFLLTDDTQIHEMNRQFRGIDRPTDVLSFPMIDFPVPGDFTFLSGEDKTEADGEYFDPDSGALCLGDICVSWDKVLMQAETYGHTPVRELAFLTAHSMLHLMGYDHIDEVEREQMEQMQEEILRGLGITR